MSTTASSELEKAQSDHYIDSLAFEEQIKALAEALWQQRSGGSRFELSDWLKAEREYRESWEQSENRR